MGRIAEAYARAGKTLPFEKPDRWESDLATAARLLAQSPNAKAECPEPIDLELASAVRKVFLAPTSAVRSVLFCAAPGGSVMTDVAWQAAEALVAQSGKRVAFVEDPHNRAPHRPSSGHALITRIDWCPVDDAEPPAAPSSRVLGNVAPARKTNDVLGEQIADLLRRFSYVIVNVTAPMSELRPLARQVDGVIVIVTEGRTHTAAARTFVADLRADARLLGAILTT